MLQSIWHSCVAWLHSNPLAPEFRPLALGNVQSLQKGFSQRQGHQTKQRRWSDNRIENLKGAELIQHFLSLFGIAFLVGGCSPSFFQIFIGFATMFIDFRAFALFPPAVALAFRFPDVFHWLLYFPCFSIFLFGFWFIQGLLKTYIGFVQDLFRVC